MSIRVRKGTRAAQAAIITEINRMRDVLVSTNPHASITRGPTVESDDTVTAANLQVVQPNATTLATSIALANEEKAVLNMHFADMGAHKTVQTAAITTPDAFDLTSAQTLLNAIKAAYNTGGHVNTANVHWTNDGTNLITAADASNQGTANTLANDIKVQVNAHIIAGLAGWSIQLVDG